MRRHTRPEGFDEDVGRAGEVGFAEAGGACH